MAQHRSNRRPSSPPESPVLARRKLAARRVLNGRRRVFATTNIYPNSRASVASSASSSSPTSARAVLVPLQFNLRRLPSRSHLKRSETMQDAVEIGSKRKRTASGSENTHTHGRSDGAGGGAKRRKAAAHSSDEESSTMDVDEQSRWEVSEGSDGESSLGSSASYLINEAPPRQLLRLRKDELIRLYQAAGLTDDAVLLTKPEIVDCIVAVRDDLVSLPPSSPPGTLDSGSSDYSSDGGNVAGGEETDIGHRLRNGMRRRATVQDVTYSAAKPATERCFSLGDLRLKGKGLPSRKGSLQHIGKRRGASKASSNRSSPTTSLASSSLPSPPATRTRSRKTSAESSDVVPSLPTSKGRGKAKHVGFSQDIRVQPAYPSGEDSDLTDLTEVEEKRTIPTTPVPRRPRNKDSTLPPDGGLKDTAESGRRVTPMRKAKGKVGSLKEDSTEEEEEDDQEEDQLAEESERGEGDEEESGSPPSTPKPPSSARRTPLRKRLRSRAHLLTPPSDGDDEGSDEGNVDESVNLVEDLDGDEDEEEEEEEADGEVEEVVELEVVDEEQSGSEEGSTIEEDPTLSQPRTLRNGKVVGVDATDEVSEEENDSSSEQDTASVDLDAEGETEEETDETMEDEFDLTIATAKSLVRLRRGDLVRLCETRDLEATGTKPQLAEALLQWRDRHCSEISSSPSSTGTARPPSTARPRTRRKARTNSGTPPVLLRPDRFHMDEPRTPPISQHAKELEPELELDLESLGLEDREIPPDKLTKLEKIGTGGFKDVFIGRFKGRRVAIAEFRGQLNAMDVKELKLLGDFDHPNIVRFLGVSIPENPRDTPVMIVSELCTNGDLFDYVRNSPPPTLYRAMCMMLDIANGLAYLHTRRPSVIHRDCKSSNVLITSKGVAKITDFGLAKVKQSTRSMVRSLVGTVNWQAPELWHAHPKYNHKVDVFSCGLVFWEILQWHLPSKKFPWEGMNEHAIYDLVGAKHQRPSVRGLADYWCPEIVDLVERMWKQDHQERPTMSEVVDELKILVHDCR